jgi:transposase InsO family protein
VARYTGFNHSTIVRWVKKQGWLIPTLELSLLPAPGPKVILILYHAWEVIRAILDHRAQYGRCAEVIHYDLIKQGLKVSLSSVKRTLKRHGLTYPSKWKKWHTYPKRPQPEKPGVLVQIDSMREGLPQAGMYVYALIDVCSRWAYAKPVRKVNSWESAKFYKETKDVSPFPIKLIQSDHGSEFAKWFSKQLLSDGIEHRHSRVRRPTDNG